VRPLQAVALGPSERLRSQPQATSATPHQPLRITGSGQNRHAYWLLREPIDVDQVERVNRRLALALGADAQSSDAARILRPAGSLNRKHSPPTPVRLLELDERRRVAIAQLERQLPPESLPLRTITTPRTTHEPPIDPLRAVAPALYVERLTGQRVGRSRKVRCPFHDDQTPSLHVYPDPDRGWYCFGCARGGSIYDLAALLWQRETRGQDFLVLRRELEALVSRAT
jgi:CHC2 zinc finger/RepB DNA-primase from phage plasmid